MEIESEEPKDLGGHPTTVCFDSLIEYAAERLAFCVRKTKLKIELSCILYGEEVEGSGIPKKRIAPRSYETLVGKARAILRERSLISSQEAREESIGFYENLLADEDTPSFARIKARENLDRIKQQSLSGVLPEEQVIDLDKIDIVIRKKILNDMRNPPSSE